MIGKILFAQTTELINPALNNGLPPNLAPDDPSLSYCMKGVDINMAAYQSELGFLTNAVSSHVQSAEMHNQSLNSLALVSARYALQSVEIASLMSASAIYVGLQGVDLRVMHKTFLEGFRAHVHDLVNRLFSGKVANDCLSLLQREVWGQICDSWSATASLDARQRCEKVAKSTIEPVMACICHSCPIHDPTDFVWTITTWRQDLQQSILDSFLAHRDQFFARPPTMSYLGRGTKALYRFVREELGVPFYRGLDENLAFGDEIAGRPKKTIGSWISIIYEALRDGRLCGEILESVADLIVDTTE
jgi:phenylalanine ammonia-lyase